MGERDKVCCEKQKKAPADGGVSPLFERRNWLLWDSMGLVHGVDSFFIPLGQLLLAGMDSLLFSPQTVLADSLRSKSKVFNYWGLRALAELYTGDHSSHIPSYLKLERTKNPTEQTDRICLVSPPPRNDRNPAFAHGD